MYIVTKCPIIYECIQLEFIWNFLQHYVRNIKYMYRKNNPLQNKNMHIFHRFRRDILLQVSCMLLFIMG